MPILAARLFTHTVDQRQQDNPHTQLILEPRLVQHTADMGNWTLYTYCGSWQQGSSHILFCWYRQQDSLQTLLMLTVGLFTHVAYPGNRILCTHNHGTHTHILLILAAGRSTPRIMVVSFLFKTWFSAGNKILCPLLNLSPGPLIHTSCLVLPWSRDQKPVDINNPGIRSLHCLPILADESFNLSWFWQRDLYLCLISMHHPLPTADNHSKVFY